MATGRFFRGSAAVLGFTFGAAVVTAGQTAQIDAELQFQLFLQQRAQQRAQEKAALKPPGKVLPPVPSTVPEGSIAHLGDTRLRHAARPLCVTFSPDSKRVYSGGEDGMLRVWDAATGAAMNSLHSPDVAVQQVSFTHGGTQVAIQFSESRIHFLNPDTLKENSQFTAQFGADFAISNDGRMIAHLAPNGMLTVTEHAVNLEKLEVPVGSPYQFHPNNKLFAVASPKGVVTLYMLAGGKPVIEFDTGGKVTGLAFSPDGKRVACGVGSIAKVWDIADGKSAKVVAEIKETGRVGKWLDNDRLAAGNADSAGVYDLTAKKWVGRAQGIGGEWAISPDGTKLAAIGAYGLRIRLWDLTTGTQLHAENNTFPEAALLAPSADGKAVFVLAGESAFNWPIGKTTATVVGKLPGRPMAAATGKDRLAIATSEAVLVYDNFHDAKPLAVKPSSTFTENAVGCRAVAVSRDGKKLAYSGDAARIVIADATAGKTLRTLPTQTIALGLAFDPTGDKLVTLGRDGFLRLSPTDEGDDIWKVRVQRGARGTVAFSPDGKFIAASSSGLIKVVNSSDGTEVFSVGGLFDNGLFQQIQFSPDSRLLIGASEGMTGGVRVWELSTQSLVRRFTTGYGTVYRLGLFADGTRLVSAGVEEAITVWDLAGRHGKDAPKADELLAACANLGSLDGSLGYPATRMLVAAGSLGVQAVASKMDEILETRKHVAGWVKELGSEDFTEREAAKKELLALGIRALPAVQAAASKAESPEVRARAVEITIKLAAKAIRIPENGLAGDALCLVRATEVLEDVGTPEALALLDRIADMGGQSGDAAKAAKARLAKR